MNNQLELHEEKEKSKNDPTKAALWKSVREKYRREINILETVIPENNASLLTKDEVKALIVTLYLPKHSGEMLKELVHGLA